MKTVSEIMGMLGRAFLPNNARPGILLLAFAPQKLYSISSALPSIQSPGDVPMLTV
jgi:hypothetical protein